MHENILKDFKNDIKGMISVHNALVYYSQKITTQSEWDTLFAEIDSFFRSQLPSKGSANTFMSSISSLVSKKSLISSQGAASAFNLINYITSTYTKVLISSQLSEI